VSTQGAVLGVGRWPQAATVSGIRTGRLHTAALGLAAVAIGSLSFLHPSGPGNTSPTDVAIVAALLVIGWWAYRARVMLRAPFGLSFGLLILAGCFSGIAGPALRAFKGPVDIGYPESAVLAVVQEVFLLCWCLALVNLARSAVALRTILAAWVVGAAIAAAVLIFGVVFGVAALSGVSDSNGVRAQGTFGDPNMAANYFALAIFVLWSGAFPRRAWMRVCLAAWLLAAMVLTGSNGAFLNLGVGIAFVVLNAVWRRSGPVGAVMVACVALLIGFGSTQLVNVTAIQHAARDSGIPILHDWIGRSDASASERLVLLQESWNLFRQSAPLGTGPNATRPLLTDSLAPYEHQAHDDYVAAVVERGVEGGVALMVLIGAIVLRARHALGGQLKPDFAAVVPRRAPLVGAVLGLAVAAAYYEVLHFRHVWALLAVIAAVQLWGRDWSKR
jgi:hypothetical protein